MIVLKRENDLIMIEQNLHAYLSGEMAKCFNKNLFRSMDLWEEALLAVYEHDRSWIGLDETPSWNEEKKLPYSFVDYPLVPKLQAYQKGIDELEGRSAYAALLCSKHYCSFFKCSKEEAVQKFLAAETKRQIALDKGFDVELLHQHFRLLQFCDDLSLYICLNEPGTKKSEEHPWFRNGMANSEVFNQLKEVPLKAKWLNEREVEVQPFPFEREFLLKLKYKSIPIDLVDVKGIKVAYQQGKVEEYELKIK